MADRGVEEAGEAMTPLGCLYKSTYRMIELLFGKS